MATKLIGFVFIQGYADWEFGFLSGSRGEGFDIRCIALTPDGAPVDSIGGFQLVGRRGLTPEENADLDAVAVIGSEGWAAETAPDVAPLLTSVEKRGGVVGGICAGTLALARSGLFKDRAHTGNGLDWVLHHLPDYSGVERYRDAPHAVVDDRVVSAPGSAPVTFATTFLTALFPGEKERIAQMHEFCAAEHGASGPQSS